MPIAATAHVSLPPLPYAENALEPVISSKTLSFHHDKHHKGYVDTTNRLIAGTELADVPLEQIVTATAGKADRASLFNNAAQAWNHGFYWQCPKPNGGGEPPSALKHAMEEAFGSIDHVNEVIDKLANWEFAAQNLARVPRR